MENKRNKGEAINERVVEKAKKTRSGKEKVDNWKV